MVLTPEDQQIIYIPSLCLCGCNETVWSGKKYRRGHYLRTVLPGYGAHKYGKIAWNKGLNKYIDNRVKLNGAIQRGKKKKLTEEQRKRLSERQKGSRSFWYGKHHTEEEKKKISNAQKGEKNHRFGKHYSKAEKKLISDKLKGKNRGKKPWARAALRRWHDKCIENPELHQNRKLGNAGFVSKPQKMLYDIVKGVFSDAELEYPIRTNQTIRFADVGIPSKKIDFEYNEPYWHRNVEKDIKRKEEIELMGWRVFFVNDITNMTKEKILVIINAT